MGKGTGKGLGIGAGYKYGKHAGAVGGGRAVVCKQR